MSSTPPRRRTSPPRRTPAPSGRIAARSTPNYAYTPGAVQSRISRTVLDPPTLAAVGQNPLPESAIATGSSEAAGSTARSRSSHGRESRQLPVADESTTHADPSSAFVSTVLSPMPRPREWRPGAPGAYSECRALVDSREHGQPTITAVRPRPLRESAGRGRRPRGRAGGSRAVPGSRWS